MTELSPAQIQERRDAARARWARAREVGAAAGGGAAAGVVGGYVTRGTLQAARNRLVSRQRAYALPPLQAAIADNASREKFINTRASKAKTEIRSEKTFLPAAIRAYSIKGRIGDRIASALAAHQAQHSETYFDSTSGATVRATDDLPGEKKLQDKAIAVGADERQRFKALADDLRARGKNPVKVSRKGGIVAPKVSSFSQSYRGKPYLAMPGTSRDTLNQIFSHDADAATTDKSALHELGIKSVPDMERHMAALSPGDRTAFAAFLKHEIGLNGVKLRRPRETKEVRNAFRVVPDHETTVPGYPKPKVRQDIRAEMLRDIENRQRAKLADQAEHAAAQIGDARARVHDAATALRWLRPGSVARRGIVGAGIGASVLAGAFAAARAERAYENRQIAKLAPGGGIGHFGQLSKANPGVSPGGEDGDDKTSPPGLATPRKRRSTADRLFDAAGEIEGKLAAGVGNALASWKDAVTPESVVNPDAQGSLFDHLDESLAAGMAPLDQATRAGITAPARIQPPGGGDDGREPRKRLISFGFGLRNNAVEQYAKTYRYSRVRDITDAQRKNIRQIIIEATQTGAPPAEIAKKVRDVVGLTAAQAATVRNYRTLLETADPRALSYDLRDRRFDSTVRGAIEAKTPLVEASIDKLVDIYQRRFIAHRAMTIARTEALRAANNGHVKTVSDWLANNPDYTVAKTWIATEDDRTRPDHRGLHRQTVIGLQTPFVCESGEKIRWPHDPLGAAKEVINCFHPETVIQGEVLIAIRAAYSGPMREIITRSGAKLTVTPHHPVATAQGFFDAVTLNKGDNLVRYIGRQENLAVPGLSDYKQNKPAKIKEIFDTLWLKWRASSVEVGSHDFHGDAEFVEGEIDIVLCDRELKIDHNAAGTKLFEQLHLSASHSGQSVMESGSASSSDLLTFDAPSGGGVGGGNLASDTSGIGFDFRPLQGLRFGSASDLDFVLDEAAGENPASEASLIGDLFERNAAFVAFDEVIEVRDFYYSGHVYDVQTTSKCVFAQDLLASNCRCTLLTSLIPRSAAAKHGPSAYEQPTENYWEGPRPAYFVDDPDEIFGRPDLEPA